MTAGICAKIKNTFSLSQGRSFRACTRREMTNVRDYLRSREKRKSTGTRINYREKIRGHRLTVFYRVLLGILLVSAVVVMLYVSWQNREYRETVVTGSVPISRADGAVCLSLSGNILTYSKDGANCMDKKGNVLWNQTYEMQNPLVDINGSVVAIGDYNGRTIYVMDTQGIRGEITTNMPIRSFRVSAGGIVAAVLDDAEVTRINLMDTSGNIIAEFKTRMGQSGYPLDVSISPNGELVAVSYFYVDSGVMKTSIAFYNFGVVGQNQSSDRFVSGYDYKDTVVPFIKVMNSNTTFAVSDDRLMFFSGDQKPLSAAEILLDEEIQGIFYNEEYVGLVCLDTSGDGKYRLDVYNTTGALVTSKSFDTDYKDIIFYKDDIIIYSETEYSVSNMRGMVRISERFAEPVYLFTPADKSNHFLSVTQDSLNILEMK